MNYIEWALQRGAELWRAREEALKKRLPLVPEGTAQKKAAEVGACRTTCGGERRGGNCGRSSG